MARWSEAHRPARPAGAAAGFLALVALGLPVLTPGCRPMADSDRAPVVATTTSYLEAAVYDLLGEEAPVLRLAEPGTCPGHFDLRPSQAEALRRCRVLLRFDFQKSLETHLAGRDTKGPAVGAITVRRGMGLPESYLEACRQAAEHLVGAGLLERATAEVRLGALAARLETLGSELTKRVAQSGLAGMPVVASAHQRDFCEWLGLRVVATFRAADTSSIREIEQTITAGRWAEVKLVVANRPEGRRTADALAERLGARVVVFENFPDRVNGRISFDQMIRANLARLLL